MIPYLTQIYLETLGLSYWQSFYGGLMVLGLGGIFRMNALGYILIDAPMICLSLLSSIFFIQGNLILGIIFLILASLTKESAPVWIALFTMSFLPLAGFLIVAIVYLFNLPSKTDSLCYSKLYHVYLERVSKRKITPEQLTAKLNDNELILKRPFTGGLHFNKNWLRPELLLGWGICLAGLLYTGVNWEWILAGVVIGYLQLFIATDTIRLLQYSFPLVIYASVQVLPMNLMPLLLALHLFNSYNEYIL